MATATKWSNIAIAIQSALGTANTISGITKASPAVVTYTGADPSNGDYIVLSVVGMSQVDARIFRVANVNAGGNTLELEGLDSTLFDTFSSGSFEVITFGTTLSTLTGVSASGGDFDFIDTTTIHDNVRKQIPGVASPSVYSFESLWDVSDAGLVALKSASDSQAQRAVRMTFANGQKLVFVGYIGATLLPTGSAQELVKTSVQITGYGKPTVYAS
jgi:hypothetical protein